MTTQIRTNQIAVGEAAEGQVIKVIGGQWLAGDESGGAALSWIEDRADIAADAAPYTADLLYAPDEYSVMVIVNGLVLLRDDEWSVYEASGWHVDVNEVYDGDVLVIRYVQAAP